MNQLTLNTYSERKAFVVQNREAVYQWALVIRAIRESGDWKADAPTWQEWCAKFAGKSANAIRQIIWKENHKEQLKAAKELLQDSKIREQARISEFTSNVEEKNNQKQVIDVSAKIDRSEPVQHTTPPPLPAPAPKVQAPEPIKPELVPVLRELRLEVESLLGTAAFARNERLLRCQQKLKVLLSDLEGDLFGEGQPTQGKFVPPTLEVVKLYAGRRAWPEAEAEKFWYHYDSKGWKVGNTPMKSWHSAIALWMTRNNEPNQSNQFNGNARRPGPARAIRPDYSKGF